MDGTLTYASLPAGADLADRQQKWKLLDKCILSLMASTIDDLLLSHVIYDWANPTTFPSIAKALLQSIFFLIASICSRSCAVLICCGDYIPTTGITACTS
jgi:hypothetical protein